MDRLGPLDAAFVEAEDEDRHTSMAIASVAVFDGPPPTYEEFVDAIGERLPLVPRYRQKLLTVPFRLGPPVWVDDPVFDLRFHIRQTALPEPGGDDELARLMSRVMAQRLDRDRPLWEDWLVTGLADGHWAVISKVHHCMVDGVSGTDLYRVMFDPAAGEASPPDYHPEPAPSLLSLAGRAAADGLMLPLRGGTALLRILTAPSSTAAELSGLLRALRSGSAAVPPAHKSSLSGPIGQQRRYTWARVPLDDLREIKAAHGATVNDVVLAAISSGFRTLLLSRGETPAPHTLPSLVPVSLRPPGGESVYDNEVSAMIVDLPVHIADPLSQLETLRREVRTLKRSGEARVGEAMVAVARYVPYGPWASFIRLAFRLPQREIVTVTTNVPGPRQTLYCLGRPLVDIIPYVPIASRVRVGIAIFSYRDTVTFGITGDYDTTPDLDVLARGIEDGVAELLKTARELSPSRPRRADRRRSRAD